MTTFSGCSESESVADGINGDNPNIIHIAGIERDALTTSLSGYTTRATGDNESVDAETVPWLLGPLFGGLDITYGLKGKEAETQKVAILKLQKATSSDDISSSNIKYSTYTGPKDEKIAEYSFKYRTNGGAEGEDAIWYDNGQHYFQGVFVPDNLRYLSENSQTPETVNNPTDGKAKNLKLDQSKEGNDDNYTLLARYLGMPADASIHATVGRVKLPFRHRLARVIAYVLIDPTMGNDVTIQGYELINGKDDAATSEIKFCNVKVLAGVEEKDDAETGHATLTPRWDTSRKVIPHFVEESGSKNSSDEVVDPDNFIMFYDSDNKEYIFPTNDAKSSTTQVSWEKANTDWNAAYTKALDNQSQDDPRRESKAAEEADKNTKLKRTKYGKVPVYDLIVRPTYKTKDLVMYDEQNDDGQSLTDTEKEDLVTLKNNIDFEITLSNGLQYEKNFTFDLDANYQTIVYLRISRESIDYNSSGADVWKEETNPDGYYGVNNQNGNTLSFAGSSWQRAYRIGSTNPGITDGHYYGQDDNTDDNTDDDAVQVDDNMPWYPQYVDLTKWVQMFAEAYMDPVTGKKGLHHGDYFILDQNITIDATKLPDNFVFTGHLDGQDHTITLTHGGESWEEWNDATSTDIEDGSITIYTAKSKSSPFVMPSPLFTKVHHDAVPYEESELTEIGGKKYVTTSLTHVPASDAVYYANVDEYNAAKGKELTADQYEALPDAEKIKTPAVEEHYVVNAGSILGTTPKVAAYDDYTEANPSRATLLTSADDSYYTRSGTEGNYTYPPYKPSTLNLYTVKDHISGTTLFAGLNGIYDAAIGEANVHKENGIFVPYVDNQTKTGWRAEIINTKIKGADLFPFTNPSEDSKSVLKVDGSYNDKVSGYVYNCWKVSSDDSREKIKSHTPALPKYK